MTSGASGDSSFPTEAGAQGAGDAAPARDLLVLLDLINKCNLRCTMCSYSSEAEAPVHRMPEEKFRHIADFLFPRARQVNLSCAYEPLMARDFRTLIRTIRDYDIPKTAIVTNGMLLSADIIDAIVDAGLSHIVVSVDGATKETYESIRIGADFEVLLDNLGLLAKRKRERNSLSPRLQVNFVMLEHNLAEVVDLIRLLTPYDSYKFVFVHEDYTRPPEGRVRRVEDALQRALDACAERAALFEEVPDIVLAKQRILEAFGCGSERPRAYTDGCMDPWRFVRITPTGDVLMCPGISTSAGNLGEQTIEEIWRGEAYERLRDQIRHRNPPPECAVCPYSNFGLTQMRWEQDRLEERVHARLSLT
jgi:radical SAM protein with 4Fe4S-binding SPASM domain